MARFLIATIPVVGHVNPGLPIARELIRRGHEVRWYTGREFQKKIEATGATYLPMKHAPDFSDEKVFGDSMGDREKVRGLARLRWDLKFGFIDPIPGQVKDLEEILAEYPADVILGDTAFGGGAAINEKGGPVNATFGITALTTSSRDTAPFGFGLSPSRTPLGRVRNFLLNQLVNNVLFRDVNEHAQKMRESIGLPRTRTPFLDSGMPKYLFLQSTIPQFEYPRTDLPPQAHFIGAFLPDAPNTEFTPPAWWDEIHSGKPVVLLTQGTVATNFEELMIPTLRALADEDVLVVVTTAGKPLEMPDLPANARVASFLPYNRLMPHVDVLVTNGGYGTVQIALSHGVPIVSSGTSEDKPEICNRIAWSGVGLRLKGSRLATSAIRDAVRRVLTEARFKQRAMELQAEFARRDAPSEAARLLERLAATKQPVLHPLSEAAEPSIGEPVAALGR